MKFGGKKKKKGEKMDKDYTKISQEEFDLLNKNKGGGYHGRKKNVQQ